VSTLIWTFIAFASGALPFSLWIGQLALNTDVRQYGDGNPGATNVLRAGGKGWALIAAVLDMLKGALPVGLAYTVMGIQDRSVIPVALAPLLGHCFSPLLKGRGGKGVAVTGGIWIGLTYGLGGAVGTLFMTLGYLVQDSDGWAVLIGLLSIGGYLALLNRDWVLFTIWALNSLLVLWRYREAFNRSPSWRSWIRQMRQDS
jgi:glycerol-3-phosphate acyltransferase PlsY